MVIVRPSIVGAAYSDPHVGWVDNLAALSGFIFVYGIGLLHQAPGKFSNRANFIPVDYVVNTIIACAVYQAGNNALLVCHAANQYINPVTHREVIQSIHDFSERNPFDRKAFKLKMKLYKERIFHMRKKIGEWKMNTLSAVSKVSTKSF